MTASSGYNANAAADGLKLIDAIHAFSELVRPSEPEKDAIEALALPLLPKLDRHALRQIATLLAQAAQTPPKLATAIGLLDTSISSAFLALSPALSVKLLLDIISRGTTDHARAIARRSHLPVEVRDALRALYDERIDRALDLRQKPDKRRLTSRAPDVIEDIGSDSKDTFACTKTDMLDLIDLARAGHTRAITTFLSEKLNISMEGAGVLTGHLSSGNLLHALRVMGFETDDAWDFYEAIAKERTRSEGVERRFRMAYAGLTIDMSLRIVNAWRLDDIMHQCLSAPDVADENAA